jgi:hypothetical protein
MRNASLVVALLGAMMVLAGWVQAYRAGERTSRG